MHRSSTMLTDIHCGASSLDKEIKERFANGETRKRQAVGEAVGKRALKKASKRFADRGGFLYHGRVKELADGAPAGLKF